MESWKKRLEIYEKGLTVKKARRIQEELKSRCRDEQFSAVPSLIGGTDVSLDRGWLIGVLVVLSYPDCELIDMAHSRRRVCFPYVPGYLGFREIPVLLEAWHKLKKKPDLVVCDGQGQAHPRGFGLACHFGVEIDCPTIGCGKSRLIGEYKEPGTRRGDFESLWFQNREIGVALRSREGTKVIFVSPGHRMTLSDSRRIINRCCSRYRVPEPTRQAHLFAARLKDSEKGTKDGTPGRTTFRKSPLN